MRHTFLALFLFFTAIATRAQTSILPGNVSGTWTLAGSPYLIQGNILVPDNSTLSIEPGVTVEFQGHYKLFCNGRILAIGTSTEKISFTVPAANISSGWIGIRYEDTPTGNDSSYFKYCSIQYGNANAVPLNDHEGGAFYFRNFSKCVIDNCSIENNYAKDGGGAIYGENASPRIVNSYFRNNTTYEGGSCIQLNNSTSIIDNNVVEDGGFYIYNSTLTLSNNKVSGSNQGAVTCFNSNLTIRDNIFENNTNRNGAGGGGILAHTSRVKIVKNIIRNNSTDFCGGGITLADNSVNTNSVISNNLLYGNRTGTNTLGFGNGGGAIYCAFNSPLIVNNTICNNISATSGGGLYCIANSDPVVQSNIIFNNQAAFGTESIFLDDNLSDPSFFYNDIQGNIAGINANGNPYTGANSNNIDAAPGFIDEAGFNYDLDVNSVCIDAGDPASATNLNIPSLDIAQRTRIKNSRIDIGAYENQSLIVVPVRLLYFNALKNAGATLLNWQYGSGCKEFEVQKSSNAVDFTTIEMVPSNPGGSNYRYSYSDGKPLTGKNYYRLKIKGLDGNYTYSNICLLTYDAVINELFVYPNPAVSNVFVKGDFKSDMVSVTITDISGKLLLKRNVIPNQGKIDIPVVSLNRGMYIVNISDGGQVTIKKIFKN